MPHDDEGDMDDARHPFPAQVGRNSAGERRLDAAARVRHLAALMVPVQRCTPIDIPRPR